MSDADSGSVLQLRIDATDGDARTGVVMTARGSFRTPCFMPVGTRGAVRMLTSADLEDLGAEVILGNTYHLMLKPGADLIERFGGLHGFADWRGHVLTDSGGFQIFSLEPKVTDEGARFRSTYDGSYHHLSPESSVEVQQKLGSDIQMVLDVCPPLPSSDAVIRAALERSILWAGRAKAAQAPARGQGSTQAQFGIVQGGVSVAMRTESAQRTLEIDFDGYGIGGLSVGESRAEMLPALAAVTEIVPKDRPRYLMGVGDPVSIVEAVALGVDMFDCVLPTRLARHGTILTSAGRLNLRNARFADDPDPLEPGCGCEACARWSRAYLRHLLMVNEPTAARLTTIHNVHWLLRLMESAQSSIAAGTYDQFRAEIASVWA
ncbi:MAG: tRNA guanosine(34) transglycosylase Tgt [Acidimicrobiales bacterium]